MAAYPRCRNAGSLFWDVFAWNLAEWISCAEYKALQAELAEQKQELAALHYLLEAAAISDALSGGRPAVDKQQLARKQPHDPTLL